MAEEKDTAAPAKRTAGKTGRRKKPEAEHAARAAPQDKDTGSKAQELLEQARTEPKPEWEVAEQVVLLPLDRLRPFKNHPFKVNDEDELMQDTIDSIMAGGVINPILVRPAEDGKFEVVSGHRRFRASELAGKADIKAIVREMDDDTAVITMVDSNLQRENILPSERAFSYRMKMEALTHQGQRTDPTLRQLGAKFRTAELVGQPAGDSARQVQRFIRLTELIPQLLDMVDRKELAFNPAVELSYLKPHEQEQFLDAMDYAQATPSLSQAQRLKRLSQNGQCTLEAMYEIMDEDMQTIAEVLKKIEDYSISNRAEFEALVKKNLAMQQTDKTKKQQKRIPQITTRLEQIDKVLNKLYEDNALGTIPQDRYEQMSQKYSEEYYALKAELAILQEQLSAYENAGGRAQKFLKLTERHAAFTDLTPAILNEFISRIEVHERDQKRARYAIQHISIYFNYIGRFENEVTQLAEPTEQEIRQMREEIEEAKKEKSRAYHRQYSREYRARNLEKRREYDRMKAREYRAKKKAQEAAAAPAQ